MANLERTLVLALYVDFHFKSLTEDKLNEIRTTIEKMRRKFTIIYASSEPCVYKIANYISDNYNSNEVPLKTIDGSAIECYFDVGANPKYNHIQMKHLLENSVLSDIAGKLLVIPKMTAKWNKELVYYFYNEVKYSDALGILFFSDASSGNHEHFGKVLLEDTTLDVLQFPNKIFRNRKVIEDDHW